MNKNDQNFMIQKIRAQYTEKESSELDTLKALDAKVKRPANVFGYTFGTIGALIMGCGMSLAMTDLGQTLGMENPMIPGVVIGLVGIAMALGNYPIYKKILEGRRKRYAQQILALSDQMMAQ